MICLPRRGLLFGAAALAAAAQMHADEAIAAYPTLKDALLGSLQRPLISADFTDGMVGAPGRFVITASASAGLPATFSGVTPGAVVVSPSSGAIAKTRSPAYDVTGTKALGIGLFPSTTLGFDNSAGYVTQTNTLPVGTHTLWMVGSGSVTLSGGASGVATDGSPLVFTIAGAPASCTFTVAGSPSFVQCDQNRSQAMGMTVGAFNDTIAGQSLQCNLATVGSVGAKRPDFTLLIDYIIPALLVADVTSLQGGNYIACAGPSTVGTANSGLLISSTSSTQVTATSNSAVGAALATLTQNSNGLNVLNRIVVATDSKSIAMSVNGQATSVSATAALVATTGFLTLGSLGLSNLNGNAQLGGYIRRFALFPGRLPNLLLPQLSRIMQT